MREGPLAALFRKTEEDAKHAEAEVEPTPLEEIPPREAPHPSLSHPSPPIEEDDPFIPSPQDRLRSAFSSELPDNLLEP
ncbi:MAG TPA: cell division protein FtsZ, partial [Solirubrobacteraceae bacterium]|nr:cell division protein FtsZ [Solirubrobacteraceae bacterium]